MVHRLSTREIRDLVSRDVGVSEADKVGLAVPSYLHWNPLIRWLMWRRYEVIAELAELSGETVVLEFGCGLGLFLPTLAEAAGQVSALDLFPQFAQELCRERGLDVAFPAGLSEVADGSLDLLIAADVLEHVDDLAGFIETFRAKLKPSGRLIVSGPTETLVYRIGRVLAGFAGMGEYHVRDIGQVRRALVAGGFRLGRRRGLPFALPPHLFLIFEFVRE